MKNTKLHGVDERRVFWPMFTETFILVLWVERIGLHEVVALFYKHPVQVDLHTKMWGGTFCNYNIMFDHTTLFGISSWLAFSSSVYNNKKKFQQLNSGNSLVDLFIILNNSFIVRKTSLERV